MGMEREPGKDDEETIGKMIVILPFEKDYFKNKWNWEVEYVGHPLVEVIDESIVRSWEPGVGSSQSLVNSHNPRFRV